MVSTLITVLALSAAALAHPSLGKRQHHHHFHSSGTGASSAYVARPTGGLFFNGTGSFNSTGSFNGTDFGNASLPMSTVTVSPLAAESTVPVAIVASTATTELVAVSSSTSCSSSTYYTTTTSVMMFTVTQRALSSSTAAVSSAGAFFGKPNGGAPSLSSSSVATTFVTSSPVVSVASSSVASSKTSSSAPASSTSSAAIVASSVVSTTSDSSSKKGLSYNVASLTDAFDGKAISWAYNWAATADGTILTSAEYVPMLWGLDATSAWSSAAQSAISSGSTHLLSFNEPDLAAQSNISPTDAAAAYIQYMNPLAGSAQLGAPAVTNGAGTDPLMGIDWLNAFFKACGTECNIDFVPFHWYNDASEIQDFEDHVNAVIAAASAVGIEKVWVTEFGATGDAADVATFLSAAVSFLDSTPQVERYAYFMCSDGVLLSGTSISALGETYLS